MSTYEFVEVQMREAIYLADLNGIQIDLQATIDLCNRLLNICKVRQLDYELSEALSIAILVKYSRSFVTGVRKKLSIDNVPGLTNDELEKHNQFIALRNKHIAHSVNEFEENMVKAYYNDERVYAEGITSISVQHARLTSLSVNDAEIIIGLSTKVIDYVNMEMKTEKAKILELVRNQPIKKVLSGGIKAFNPKMTNVDKRRKQ